MWLPAKNRDNTGGSKMTTIKKDGLITQCSSLMLAIPSLPFLYGLSACTVCSDMQTPVPESASRSLPMSYLN